MYTVYFILPQFGECHQQVSDDKLVKTIECYTMLNIEVSRVEIVD